MTASQEQHFIEIHWRKKVFLKNKQLVKTNWKVDNLDSKYKNFIRMQLLNGAWIHKR